MEQFCFFDNPPQKIVRKKAAPMGHMRLLRVLLAEVQAGDFAHYAFLGALAKHCGPGEALLFCARFSGEKMPPDSALKKMRGKTALKMKDTCSSWGAEVVHIPRFENALMEVRNRAMQQEYQLGISLSQISQRWGVTRRTVHRTLKKL